MGIIKDEKDLIPNGIEFLKHYIDDFSELSTTRHIGMGVGPIPLTAILSYIEYRQIEDKEDFLYLMRQMDNGYMLGNSELREKESKDGRKEANKKSGHRGKNNGRGRG